VSLAEANHRLRPNGETKLLLAEACFKQNDLARARTLLGEVFETPWRTPEVRRLSRLILGDGGVPP
jgi:hypothetical protein